MNVRLQILYYQSRTVRGSTEGWEMANRFNMPIKSDVRSSFQLAIEWMDIPYVINVRGSAGFPPADLTVNMQLLSGEWSFEVSTSAETKTKKLMAYSIYREKFRIVLEEGAAVGGRGKRFLVTCARDVGTFFV